MAHSLQRRRFGTAANVRAALVVFALATLIMAAFLSSGLQSYVYDLPVNDVTETVVAVVDTWHGWMEAVGMAGLAHAIADCVAALHDARFGE